MKCAVCGKTIVRARLCVKHIEEYGMHASDQPEWLRYLIAETYAEDLQEAEDIDLVSFDQAEEVLAEGAPDRNTRNYYRQLYGAQLRPCEDESLDNIDRKQVVKRMIKFFGGTIIEE